MANVDLVMDLVARDKASKAFNSAGNAAGKLDKNISKTKDGFNKMKSATKALAIGLAAVGFAAATREAVQFAKASVEAASSQNEAASAVQQQFGSAADAILEWSKTSSRNFGQSRTEALKAAKTFGIFGTAAGLSGNELVGFSTGLTELASDFASFHDTSPEEAIEAIGAALRGESEPIRKYGILLDDATLKQRAMEMGIYDGNGALTQQQRVLAAQAEVMAQAGAAMGDFDRTAQGWANQQRILRADMENLKATVGQALIPVLERFAGILIAQFPKIQKAVEDAIPGVQAKLMEFADTIEGNWPAIQENFKGMADAVKRNWPQIKETAQTVADALQRVSQIAGTLWNAFQSLPPEVKTTLATLAVLQKTGAISVAFKVADGLKKVFSGITSITAGNVTVTGATVASPGGVVGGTAGKAGAAGGAGAAAAAGGVSAGTIAGFAVAVAAFGVAVHQLATGEAVERRNEQGGNPATGAGSWAAMGAGGTHNRESDAPEWQQMGWARDFAGNADTASAALDRLNASLAQGSTITKDATAMAWGWTHALGTIAVEAGLSGDQTKTMSDAILAIPPGATIYEVRDALQKAGEAAGLTQPQIDAISAAVGGMPGGSTIQELAGAMRMAGETAGASNEEINILGQTIMGIPGGATLEDLRPAIEGAGAAAGLTTQQMSIMSGAISMIPPGASVEEIRLKLTEAGNAAGMTEDQINTMVSAIGGIPPNTPAEQIAAQLQATGEAAGLTHQEIAAMTGAILGVPPEASTTITAPGAPEATDEANGLTGAVEAIPQSWETEIATPGAVESTDEAAFLDAAIREVPTAWTTDVSAPGAVTAAGQAHNVTSAVYNIPGAKSSTISTPGAGAAASQASTVGSSVRGIPQSWQSRVNVDTGGAMSKIRGLVDWARERLSSIKSALGFASGGPVWGFADGGGIPVRVSNGEYAFSPDRVKRIGMGPLMALNAGLIQGPGSGRSDSISAIAPEGSFILNAAMTKKIGVHKLNRLADGGSPGTRAVMADVMTKSAHVTVTAELYIDGKMLHESLVRYRRSIGNQPLGLN